MTTSFVYAESSISYDFFLEYKQWAKNTISLYKNWSEELKDENIQLNKSISKSNKLNQDLKTENEMLKNEIKNQQLKYLNEYKYSTSLENSYDKLLDAYDLLDGSYDSLYDQNTELSKNFKSEQRKPQTIIKDTQVYSNFYDSKGNYYSWVTPISVFENNVLKSNVKSYVGQKLSGYVNQDSFWSKLKDAIKSEVGDELGIETVLLNHNGNTYRFQDFTSYNTNSFTSTVDSIYDNSKSNSDFINEVWYVVSQLTVYDEDVNHQSEGRYPLETLIRTGGDCEDLSILVADMLKSSRHTKEWTIQLVYFDMYNPTNPINLNHVAVYVNDGQYDYYIEATGTPNSNYYPDGITGWYYDF